MSAHAPRPEPFRAREWIGELESVPRCVLHGVNPSLNVSVLTSSAVCACACVRACVYGRACVCVGVYKFVLEVHVNVSVRLRAVGAARPAGLTARNCSSPRRTVLAAQSSPDAASEARDAASGGGLGPVTGIEPEPDPSRESGRSKGMGDTWSRTRWVAPTPHPTLGEPGSGRRCRSPPAQGPLGPAYGRPAPQPRRRGRE